MSTTHLKHLALGTFSQKGWQNNFRFTSSSVKLSLGRKILHWFQGNACFKILPKFIPNSSTTPSHLDCFKYLYSCLERVGSSAQWGGRTDGAGQGQARPDQLLPCSLFAHNLPFKPPFPSARPHLLPQTTVIPPLFPFWSWPWISHDRTSPLPSGPHWHPTVSPRLCRCLSP